MHKIGCHVFLLNPQSYGGTNRGEKFILSGFDSKLLIAFIGGRDWKSFATCCVIIVPLPTIKLFTIKHLCLFPYNGGCPNTLGRTNPYGPIGILINPCGPNAVVQVWTRPHRANHDPRTTKLSLCIETFDFSSYCIHVFYKWSIDPTYLRSHKFFVGKLYTIKKNKQKDSWS